MFFPIFESGLEEKWLVKGQFPPITFLEKIIESQSSLRPSSLRKSSCLSMVHSGTKSNNRGTITPTQRRVQFEPHTRTVAS